MNIFRLVFQSGDSSIMLPTPLSLSPREDLLVVSCPTYVQAKADWQSPTRAPSTISNKDRWLLLLCLSPYLSGSEVQVPHRIQGV